MNNQNTVFGGMSFSYTAPSGAQLMVGGDFDGSTRFFNQNGVRKERVCYNGNPVGTRRYDEQGNCWQTSYADGTSYTTTFDEQGNQFKKVEFLDRAGKRFLQLYKEKELIVTRIDGHNLAQPNPHFTPSTSEDYLHRLVKKGAGTPKMKTVLDETQFKEFPKDHLGAVTTGYQKSVIAGLSKLKV